MKKTYLSPEIDLMLAETEDMIATSPQGFDGNLNNDNNSVISDPNQMLSRQSLWSEDEVDEDF